MFTVRISEYVKIINFRILNLSFCVNNNYTIAIIDKKIKIIRCKQLNLHFNN